MASLETNHLDGLALVGIACIQCIESILQLCRVANDTASLPFFVMSAYLCLGQLEPMYSFDFALHVLVSFVGLRGL